MEKARIFFNGTSKPFVRWWWLSGPFTKTDIRTQLEWVKSRGFGGVELAWLHPGWLEEDETDKLRPPWLGSGWRELVTFAKRQAAELGLGCDFTFGSSWPFGGSWVEAQDAAQTFEGLSEQRLRGTWEEAAKGPGRIVDHLSANALRRYAEPLLEALQDALAGSRPALFCDSLELSTEGLWSNQLWAAFERRFGYSLRPYVKEDRVDDPAVRYDYRKLVGETIRREFYEEFTSICREQGANARVQCHGAPTNLIEAYAAVDIPESEALLFAPAFSRIAASAAAWAGKPIVSAEAFTCIYGFPGFDESAERLWKEEEIGDLKLLADALFAHGVNQIVWHGMPYRPAGKEVEFYAAVHVGPDSPFEARLVELNRYLERVSQLMKSGEAYGGIAIYFPWEDSLLLDRLPEERRTPGANYFWEMRDAAAPADVERFHPLWISEAFLREARVEGGRIRSRGLSMSALYVNCEWMDYDSLTEFRRLAEQGARLIWRKPTRQPGKQRNPHYATVLDELLGSTSTSLSEAGVAPLIYGDDVPHYWARKLGRDLMLFFAHPATKKIGYPMSYRLSAEAGEATLNLSVYMDSREIPMTLYFEPGQSLMVLVREDGTVENIAIGWESGQ